MTTLFTCVGMLWRTRYITMNSMLLFVVNEVHLLSAISIQNNYCLFGSGRKRAICKTLLQYSPFILLFNHERAVAKPFHVNLWLGCFLMCLAGSDCLLTSKCSLTRTSRLRAVYVSPMFVHKYICLGKWRVTGVCFCLLTGRLIPSSACLPHDKGVEPPFGACTC